MKKLLLLTLLLLMSCDSGKGDINLCESSFHQLRLGFTTIPRDKPIGLKEFHSITHGNDNCPTGGKYLFTGVGNSVNQLTSGNMLTVVCPPSSHGENFMWIEGIQPNLEITKSNKASFMKKLKEEIKKHDDGKVSYEAAVLEQFRIWLTHE